MSGTAAIDERGASLYPGDVRAQIEIEAQGKMAAAYFNPRPINVSRAEAAQEGTTTKVFIELRDINYPGATVSIWSKVSPYSSGTWWT